MEAIDLINRAFDLIKDVSAYILSNEDWIYYFINPKDKNVNRPIFDIIKEHPDCWKEYVTLKVSSFNGVSASVTIEMEDEYGEPHTYQRYIVLSSFNPDVEYNKKAMSGELNKLLIKEMNEQIDYFNVKIKELKARIKELETE